MDNENNLGSTPIQPIQTQPTQPVQLEQNEPHKNNSIIAILTVLAVIIVSVVVIAAVLLFGDNTDHVSLESVRSYCEKNGLLTDEATLDDSEPKMEWLRCESDNISVGFGVMEKPFTEYDDFQTMRSGLKSYGTILEESDDYLKAYIEFGYYGKIRYVILSGNTYMDLTASNGDLAKKALLDMGYADKNWPEEQESQGADDTFGISQRDTARRNDMSRVDTSLLQYQTNNMGNLPKGPSFWWGASEANCHPTNISCMFIKNYLNNGNNTNDFFDPDGSPYSLYITENFAEGDITPSVGDDGSLLVSDGDGYTIGGSLAFSRHRIYIIPGGKCSDDGSRIVKGAGKRHFGIMYMLESGNVYCIDDD